MPNAYTRTTTVKLSEAERAELTSMARSRSLPAALALRARIVLACEGDDKASTDVAQTLGINRGTVTKWRSRYVRHRIAGLYDELRPGRCREGHSGLALQRGRRDFAVTVDSRDFLDDIGFAVDVGPPARRPHEPRVD